MAQGQLKQETPAITWPYARTVALHPRMTFGRRVGATHASKTDATPLEGPPTWSNAKGKGAQSTDARREPPARTPSAWCSPSHWRCRWTRVDCSRPTAAYALPSGSAVPPPSRPARLAALGRTA
eukprot:scaffold280797_cov35-Tisochrysis_lutea.AAC.1